MPSQQNGAAEKFCRAALRHLTGSFSGNFANSRNLMAVSGEHPITPVENIPANRGDGK
jgi:hypothetical protein